MDYWPNTSVRIQPFLLPPRLYSRTNPAPYSAEAELERCFHYIVKSVISFWVTAPSLTSTPSLVKTSFLKLGSATSCLATFRQLLRFSETFKILGKFWFFFSIFKIIFLIFRHIYKLLKEKSATFNWFILLCECVDSRGPVLERSNN